MVANDLGISVISSLQVGLLPDDVISRPFQGAYGRSLGIAIKSLRHAPPVIKEFVRICKETAAQLQQAPCRNRRMIPVERPVLTLFF